jgi:hypothetical protein
MHERGVAAAGGDQRLEVGIVLAQARAAGEVEADIEGIASVVTRTTLSANVCEPRCGKRRKCEPTNPVHTLFVFHAPGRILWFPACPASRPVVILSVYPSLPRLSDTIESDRRMTVCRTCE